jgi:hypothetical protein
MAIGDTTRTEQGGSLPRLSLNRVQKKIQVAGTSLGGWESSRQPVIPPAPLTGDVGRGCGDASRALLFYTEIQCIPGLRPTSRPTLLRVFLS